MTPAQRLRLQKLGNKVLQAALDELDPRCFPGAGKAPAELTKQQRGDKFWHLKVTRAQLAVVSDIEQLLGVERGALATLELDSPAQTKAEIDKLIADAQRELARIKSGTPADAWAVTR
jgi:hypothetical protein